MNGELATNIVGGIVLALVGLLIWFLIVLAVRGIARTARRAGPSHDVPAWMWILAAVLSWFGFAGQQRGSGTDGMMVVAGDVSVLLPVIIVVGLVVRVVVRSTRAQKDDRRSEADEGGGPTT
jgi:hypothetical protein